MNKRGCNRGIHAARKRAKHLFVTDFLFKLADLAFGEIRHRPLALSAANLVKEVAEHVFAVLGVHDFGVELNAVKLFSSFAIAATGQVSVVPITSNPSGTALTYTV